MTLHEIMRIALAWVSGTNATCVLLSLTAREPLPKACAFFAVACLAAAFIP